MKTFEEELRDALATGNAELLNSLVGAVLDQEGAEIFMALIDCGFINSTTFPEALSSWVISQQKGVPN